MLRIACCLIWLASAGAAEVIRFAPSDANIPNPERGWWLFAADDFASATEEDIAGISAEGVTVAYGIVRLDDYRDGPLPEGIMADLDESFAMARKHGLKIILRFAYNYPGNSFDYETAKDAALPVVLGHIDQLAPMLAANGDTILVMQAGFIGAWGEGHTSSNGLDTPKAKATIRDALDAAVPAAIPLQWRYPPDILPWKNRRMGFHNDCFLSSSTDVGTYDEDPGLRAKQRAAMATLTDRTYFSGETCDADASAARTDCMSILTEGADFHLSALNRDYYEAFHKAWKAGGCYAEVSNRLGYRLRLVEAEIGADGGLRLKIANDGWARPVQPRSVIVTAYRQTQAIGQTRFLGALSDIGAGESASLKARLPRLAEADRLCFSAPDLSPRLAEDPAYAIRFANADGPGQDWDASQAAFCTDLN
jgi:hypothetical protein